MDKLNFNDLINPKNNNIDSPINSANDLISITTVNNLLDKKNLKTNSRVKYNQVSDLSKLYLFSDVFKVPFVKNLADNILQLQISINGLGRKELVELVSKVNNNDILQQDIKLTKKDIFR